MSWHYLAFAAIPVWIFAVTAVVTSICTFAMEWDDKWWGGFPLIFASIFPGIAIGFLGCICIGFYAATGLSPFS